MKIIDHTFCFLNHSLKINVLLNFHVFTIQVTLNEFLRALKETLDLEKNQENIPVGEL
jgi:hypothetical protein